MECFKIFDRTSRGFVTLSDLKDSLKYLLGYEYKSTEEAYLLFKRFDKDQDGKLNYQEFSAIFIPRDKYLGEKVQS